MFLDSVKKKTKIKKKKRKLGHLILQKKENLHITYIMYLMCYLMVFYDLKKKKFVTYIYYNMYLLFVKHNSDITLFL